MLLRGMNKINRTTLFLKGNIQEQKLHLKLMKGYIIWELLKNTF